LHIGQPQEGARRDQRHGVHRQAGKAQRFLHLNRGGTCRHETPCWISEQNRKKTLLPLAWGYLSELRTRGARQPSCKMQIAFKSLNEMPARCSCSDYVLSNSV